MCVKGGSRCASSVRESLSKNREAALVVQTRLDALADDPNHDPKVYQTTRASKWNLQRKAQVLQEEWDETGEGQSELAAEVDLARAEVVRTAEEAAVATKALRDSWTSSRSKPHDLWSTPETPETPEDTAAREALAADRRARDVHRNVADRKRAAEMRRVAKTETQACKDAGDTVGAGLTQKFGPGTAWMRDSSIPEHKMHNADISPGLLVHAEEEDSYTDEDYEGQEYYVATGTFTVEQPVTGKGPGGRLVVGAHPMAHSDALLIEHDAEGNVTGFGPTNPKAPKPTDVGSDGKDYASSADYEQTAREILDIPRDLGVDVEWDDPKVIKDTTGKPVMIRAIATYTLSVAKEKRERDDY